MSIHQLEWELTLAHWAIVILLATLCVGGVAVLAFIRSSNLEIDRFEAHAHAVCGHATKDAALKEEAVKLLVASWQNLEHARAATRGPLAGEAETQRARDALDSWMRAIAAAGETVRRQAPPAEPSQPASWVRVRATGAPMGAVSRVG